MFLVADGDLKPLDQQQYSSEDQLQDLLARFPDLLRGDDIDPTAPRRWLLVSREAGIPGENDGGDRWSLDHLFLDQDGVPTLVEVKRSSDTRLRREVVGQMLEYAANGVAYWPLDQLQDLFRGSCEASGDDPDLQLRDFIDHESPEEFWKVVKTNLQAGRIRLVFVADAIPPELQRVVKFLNDQMDPAEVVAVEISHYSGDGLETLAPTSPSMPPSTPDFGQVEGDPAVLNLTVFETRHRERRPFFLEGIQIFQSPRPGITGVTGQARLFHSRRIGRPPSRFPLPAGSRELERPDHTTILGALKLSGKTGGRTAFGLLNAVTGREEVLVEQADTVRRHVEVEPVTNYLVGRVQQDLLTNSTAGAEVTAVNGRGFDPAYVGAGDLHLKWRQNAYRIYTRLAVSRTGQEEERGTGWEGLMNFKKSGGAFGGEAHVDARSPAFQVNDLGWMKPRNRIQAGLGLYHQKLHPYWFARRSWFDLDFWVRWNYARVRLFRGIASSTSHQLHNYWGFWARVIRNFEGFDEVVTRGGPIMVAPSDTRINLSVWSDDRKPVTARFGWSLFESRSGDNLQSGVWVRLEFRPMSQLRVTIGPSYNYQRNFAQWLQNKDDDGDGEADRFIFGELDSRVLDISVRGDWTFTPTLSLQLYAQPFVTTGDYGAIKELARPRSYEFLPYAGFDGNPDFHFRSLHSNLVLRWEFRPGSTLYLVWQQNRGRGLDALDPRFRPGDDLGSTFLDPGQSILLVKGNWWLGL